MSTCPICGSSFEDGAAFCPKDGAPLSTGGPSLIGKVLGERYRVLEQIGEGGMGCVYLGEHVMLTRKVAIKVLREELSAREDLVRRFQLEAMAASKIGHEGICDVTDFGRTPNGSHYFVMEHLAGESLASIIRTRGAIPPERALPLLIQMAKALGAAHAQGIIHRDLKPDNVVLINPGERRDVVKVLDFGISKFADTGGEVLTRQGSLVGTPEYMAPEQAAGEVIDSRADIYALGVLLYEMLTGTIPFRGDTVVAVLMKHQSEPVESLVSRRPDLDFPPALESFALRLLKKRREDRPQIMLDVAVEAQSLLHALGFGPPGTGPVQPSSLPPGMPWLTPAPSQGSPLEVQSPSNFLDPAGLASAMASPAAAPRSLTQEMSASLFFGSGVPQPPPEVSPTPIRDPAPLAVEEDSRSVAAPRALRIPMVVGGLAAVAGVALFLAFGHAPASPSTVISTPTSQAQVPPPPPVIEAKQEPLAPSDTPVKVKVHSSPEGAEVYTAFGKVGKTPLEVQLKPGSRSDYRFVLAGYQPAIREVSAEDREIEQKLSRIDASGGKGQTRPASAKLPAGDGFKKVDDLKPNPFN